MLIHSSLVSFLVTMNRVFKSKVGYGLLAFVSALFVVAGVLSWNAEGTGTAFWVSTGINALIRDGIKCLEINSNLYHMLFLTIVEYQQF